MKGSKYINKVAAEVEGLWVNVPGLRGATVIKDGVNIEHDGSVHPPDQYSDRILKLVREHEKRNDTKFSLEPKAGIVCKGEIVSEPYDNPELLAAWMAKYWPDVTNNTCGLHFHISVLKNGHYSCLMQPEFNAFYQEEMKKFIETEKLNKIIQDRFFNNSKWARDYCEADFRPEQQCYVDRKIYMNQSKARYSQLNYCFSLHSTVEIRVFTAHCSSKTAIKCLNWWINLVEGYLANNYDKFVANGGLEYGVDVNQEDEEVVPVKINPQENTDEIADLMNRAEILSFPDVEDGMEVVAEEEYDVAF